MTISLMMRKRRKRKHFIQVSIWIQKRTSNFTFYLITLSKIFEIVFLISYCNIINKLPLGCLQQNVLEMWKNDKTVISELSKENIVEALNKTTIGPISGHETPFTSLLGGVQRNEAGEIISAKSILTLWMLHVTLGINYSQFKTN